MIQFTHIQLLTTATLGAGTEYQYRLLNNTQQVVEGVTSANRMTAQDDFSQRMLEAGFNQSQITDIIDSLEK